MGNDVAREMHKPGVRTARIHVDDSRRNGGRAMSFWTRAGLAWLARPPRHHEALVTLRAGRPEGVLPPLHAPAATEVHRIEPIPRPRIAHHLVHRNRDAGVGREP